MKNTKVQSVESDKKIQNITFYDNHIPGLEAGDYTLDASQQVSGTDEDGNTFTDTFSTLKIAFYVKGERFRFNPDTFYSTFPPKDFEGDACQVLPHVVLTSQTLPWQRQISSENDTYPWLALLLFSEDDPPPVVQSKTLDDLDYDTLSAKGILFPEFTLEKGETNQDKCRVIDVDADLFDDIAPTLDDMPWLAHVRKVTAVKKELKTGHRAEPKTSGPTDSEKSKKAPADKKFSLIICNRLPQLGKQSVVHLVSFENYGPYLPKDDGTSNLPPKTTWVRLVSLKNWHFTMTEVKKSLKSFAENFNKKYTTPTNLVLPEIKKEVTEDSGNETKYADEVNLALKMGYIPLNHSTREGGETVSWYRGPFIPYSTDDVLSVPISCSDGITRYNPKTGMFDVSYASAWELGQLLALRDKRFAMNLYNWKRNNAQSTINGLETHILRNELGLVDDESNDNESTSSMAFKKHIIPALSKFVEKSGETE